MENNLELNLSYIKKYNPSLAERIKNHTELKSDLKLGESQSGSPLLIKDGKSFHDKIDPDQEAIDIFHKSNKTSKYSIAIIYGLGLGYLAQRFAKSSKSKIIIFEPDLDILRVTLELVDFSDVLSKQTVMVANTAKEFEKAFERLFFIGYEINLNVLNYYKYNEPEALNEFIETAYNTNNVYQSNYRNLGEKAVEWTQAALRSVYYSSANYPLAILKDQFKGKPAVIISAGPSLSKNIDLIKDCRDKITVFCVGTALKTAFEHGIKPDFVLQVDCCFSAYRQLEPFDFSDINLIIEPTSFIDIHKIKAKNKFYYWPYNDNTSDWLAKMWGIDSTLCRNMGTVSLAAILSAKLLGFEKIILIGQDLAYTGGKCYAAGSVYDNFELNLNKTDPGKSDIATNRQNVVQHLQDFMNSKGKKVVPVKGQIEETVYAPLDYALFIIYFEDLAKELPENIKVINATEGGAYIRGYEHISFKEALAKYTDMAYSTDEIISALRPINPKTIKRRREIIYPILKEINKVSINILYKYQEDKNALALLCQKHWTTTEAPLQYKEMKYPSALEKQEMQKIYEIVKPAYDYISKLAENNYIYANMLVVQQKGVVDAIGLFDEKETDTFNYLVKNLHEYFYQALQGAHVLKVRTGQAIKDFEEE